jgi:hypothetical protein
MNFCNQFRFVVSCYLERQAVLYGHSMALENTEQIFHVASKRSIKMDFDIEKMVSRKCVKLREKEPSKFVCFDGNEDPWTFFRDTDGHIVKWAEPAYENDLRASIIGPQQKV